MKHAWVALFVIILGIAFVTGDAEARRLGGGGGAGLQRSLPTKRDTAPNLAPTRSPQSTPQPSGAARWLGPLAGLAAGIGLAALFAHLGLSEELATIAMIALFAIAAFWIFGLVSRRFR